MKSLVVLWQRVADESATRCHTRTSRDLKTVATRTKMEGVSFLTITLPNFGKDFERSLDRGVVADDVFLGFTRHAGLPRFLGGFLQRIFDRGDGTLLPNPCVDSIIAVRQLTLMFGKIALPCSDARVKRAIRGYVECEQEVEAGDRTRSAVDIAAFRRVSNLLFVDAFTYMDREIHAGRVVPKHGPGATADRRRGNAKFRQDTWPSRLEKAGFYSSDFLLPTYSYYDALERVRLLEPEAEVPVRVITVPKTLKTPRIIGIEPTAMQYAQQAILPVMLEGLRRKPLASFLGFDDQTPNQRMAREGSLTGGLATLDLSEASDRVSNQLVMEMMRNHPHLLHAVQATRSTKADVPGHGVMPLSKFASMGSALCFPVEAMVFLTTVFLGIEQALRVPLDRQTINTFAGRVRIYGDDILVPTDCVESVVDMLGNFGFRVNVAKSFWNGKFRESCGKEYYDGEDVSVVRVRQVPPTQRRHASRVVSHVSLRNQLYNAGYWGVCAELDKEIRGMLKHFPVVSESSPVQGRVSFLGYETQKLHDKLHSPLVKGYVVSANIPSDPLDDVGALLKCLLRFARDEDQQTEASVLLDLATGGVLGSLPAVDADHLERAGRPQLVDIKLRWSSPY